jgi:outer membrane protein
MKKYGIQKILVTAFLVMSMVTEGKSQRVFTSFDSLLIYIQQKSTTLQISAIKYDQARKARLAAIWGITDLTGNVSLAVTDNTRLPVSLFPAEVFGGPAGSFREVQTGIQYTNNFSQYGELKVINAQGWQNFGLANINVNFAETDSRLNEKALYENIAAAYYNILKLQQQLESNRLHVKTADTLLSIVSDKFEQGVAKQQDVNDARTNFLNIAETGNQLEFQLQQQYLTLKVLCDIPENENIQLMQEVSTQAVNTPVQPAYNVLNEQSALLKQEMARRSLRQSQYTLLPTLSLVGSNSYQQFSNDFSLFNSDVRWINSSYIGAKVVWQLPNASSISQTSKLKYEYLIAQQNAQHAAIKAQADYVQLSIDDRKERSLLSTRKTIFELRKDTYLHNLENYKAGVISLDILLNSYNSMASAEYDYTSSYIAVMHTQTRIIINNTIQ